MNKRLKKVKENKLLITIILIIIISFILGLLFPAILSNSNKKLITSSLDNFFIQIKKNNLNYFNGFISSISTNLLLTIILWVLGISIIGILFILLILIIKSFILGFSISSILITYKIKGLILMIIYIIPLIIDLFIFFILSYYAISFSIILFNYLFKKRNNISKSIIKRYIKILLFAIISIVITSSIEIFIIPNIIKLLV